MRKTLPHCVYFIRTSFFVLTGLHFAFVFKITKTPMPPAGFEPATPANDRAQAYGLDRTATGTGV